MINSKEILQYNRTYRELLFKKKELLYLYLQYTLQLQVSVSEQEEELLLSKRATLIEFLIKNDHSLLLCKETIQQETTTQETELEFQVKQVLLQIQESEEQIFSSWGIQKCQILQEKESFFQENNVKQYLKRAYGKYSY